MSFVQRMRRRLNWITTVTTALGADPVSKQKLFWGGLWLLINDTWKTDLRFAAQLSKFGKTFDFCFEDLGDYGLLCECLVDDTYDVGEAESPRVIFDLGSNIGTSVLYFSLRYPEAQIYAFEPDPSNYRRLAQHVSALSGVQAHNVAVWSTDGRMDFFSDPHRGASSSPFPLRDRQKKISVKSRTLDTLLREHGIDHVDLLKFDIEGAEQEVFKSFNGLSRVHTVVGEVQEVHEEAGGFSLEELRSLMEETHKTRVRELAPRRYLLMATRRS